MTIKDLDNKSICMLGFGREGQSVVRALEKYAPDCTLTIADGNENLDPSNYQLSIINYQFVVGANYLNNLEAYDVIIKSPGIPPLSSALCPPSLITNATQIFFDTVKEKGSTIIGVTGSKGKSTTASLIAAILPDAHLVGNIGVPVLDFIEKAEEGTIFVQELSSFQLMDTTSSPTVAVVTSFFPDHLDYHGSLEAYKESKIQITKYQTEEDIVFYADDNNGAEEIANKSPGAKHAYSEDDAPVSIEETKLIGMHNQRNMAGAWKVAEHFGVEKADAIEAIKQFKGLPHRLQNIGIHHEVAWIDDAISTTPESTIAALEALSEVDVLICGGQDRGYDFAELGKKIDASSIQTIILFPDSGANIKTSITNDINIFDVTSMEEAIAIAKELTKNTCLLSTASPSYNMFKNFEEKGDQFQSLVKLGTRN